MAEWLAGGRALPKDQNDITIAELAARFWQHAKDYYRRHNGSHTKELGSIRVLLRALKDLYGPTLVAQFGRRKLKAI